MIFILFFFLGSEMVLMVVNKIKFKIEVDKGDKKVKGIVKLFEKLSEFIIMILIGNNVVNILLLIFVIIMVLCWGISVGIVLVVLIVVIILIFEVIFKFVVVIFLDKIIRFVYLIINICVIVFCFIILFLNKLMDSINWSLFKG